MSSPTEPVPIRPAGPGDWSGAADLIWALNRFEQGLSGDRLTHRPAAVRSLAAMRARIRRRRGAILVAGPPGRIDGLIAWCEETDAPFVVPPLRRYAQVTDLVVADRARRRGIATALLEAVAEAARARGLRRLAIGVLDGNEAADRLYRAFGFRPYLALLVKPLNEA